MAVRSDADLMVRLTADNPFTNANVIDRLVDAGWLLGRAAVLSDRGPGRRLPLGFCPELLRVDALFEAGSRKLPPHHLAHVTSWLYENDQAAHFEPPASWPTRPDWRWTVDTAEDLAMADAAFAVFRREGIPEEYPAMVACLDQNPKIVALNEKVRQKAGPRDERRALGGSGGPHGGGDGRRRSLGRGDCHEPRKRRRVRDRLRATLENLAAVAEQASDIANGRIHPVVADVSTDDGLHHVLEETDRVAGRLDGWVNNAYAGPMTLLGALTRDDVAETLRAAWAM